MLKIIDRKEARKMDRYAQYAMVSSEEAIKMPILTSRLDKDRAGVIWGSGMGGLETFKLKFLILLVIHVSIVFIPK
jgi:3-oxoacyl-[acyl-carrier-protein] synthase II